MQTCPQCGRENAAGAKFCVHCGAAMPVSPVGPEPQQPGVPQQPAPQAGYSQPGYQAPYRAPRAPFTGNLLDHPPFLVVFVAALGVSLSQFLGTSLAPGSAGEWSKLFDNAVLAMLVSLIFFAGGLLGTAGCIGLWRFKEWGRMFVCASAATYMLAGLLTLIAGGMKRGDVASMILWGILMMAIGGAIIFYMFTDEVRSRMQR